MSQATLIKSNLPRVVLLGRTNVGKSTLFNKLAEKYQALVSDIAGTTRDIKTAIISWQDFKFELLDTGGLNAKHLTRDLKPQAKIKRQAEDDIDLSIVKQALKGIKQADLVLFVVDARDGLLQADRAVADWLRFNKFSQVLVAANKADGIKLRHSVGDFFKLGFHKPWPVSATTGSGSGDLLDEIIKKLNFKSFTLKSEIINLKPPIRVSIIGRPNVGKSTLLNKLLGEDRAIVSSTPHTTREPVDTALIYENQEIVLVDTAGIRRKSRISLKSLEKKGVNLSLKSLAASDLALLVVDPTQNIGQQDLKLAQLALKARVGITLISNKLDMLEQDNYQSAELPPAYQKTFNIIDWAPILLISALTGKNTHKIFDTILQVYANWQKTVNQVKLDELRKKLVAQQTPPRKKPLGRRGTRGWKPKHPPKIVNLKQIATAPPHFELVYRGVGILPVNYLNYIEKGLRASFDFTGTPIIISQRKV